MDQSQRFVAAGQNHLLSSLPRDLQVLLLPHVEKLTLRAGLRLHEAQSPATHMYFPLSGIVALAIGMKADAVVEVATVGSEGMVGAQAFLGADRIAHKSYMKVGGQVLRMRTEQVRRAAGEHRPFAALLGRYADVFFNHMALATACNSVHSVRERMCRGLLTAYDRIGADELQLTHEALARTLGVRRPSVTVAAVQLQKEGLIRYRRGRISVPNRGLLEAQACPCYFEARRALDGLRREPLA